MKKQDEEYDLQAYYCNRYFLGVVLWQTFLWSLLCHYKHWPVEVLKHGLQEVLSLIPFRKYCLSCANARQSLRGCPIPHILTYTHTLNIAVFPLPPSDVLTIQKGKKNNQKRLKRLLKLLFILSGDNKIIKQIYSPTGMISPNIYLNVGEFLFLHQRLIRVHHNLVLSARRLAFQGSNCCPHDFNSIKATNLRHQLSITKPKHEIQICRSVSAAKLSG